MRAYAGFTDYYSALGIKKTAAAQEIKEAYRKLVFQWHPDMVAESRKKEAHDKFISIQEAYEILSNPKDRFNYDALYERHFHPRAESHPEDNADQEQEFRSSEENARRKAEQYAGMSAEEFGTILGDILGLVFSVADTVLGISEDARIIEGMKLIESKDYAAAVRKFDRLVRRYPGSDAAFSNRGLAKFYLGDFDGAIQDYSRAIEINPKSRLYYYNRGAAYEAKGDKVQAEKDLRTGEYSKLAISSFVYSLIIFVLSVFLLDWAMFFLPGIVLGIAALVVINRELGTLKGKYFAIIGIVLGVISFLNFIRWSLKMILPSFT